MFCSRRARAGQGTSSRFQDWYLPATIGTQSVFGGWDAGRVRGRAAEFLTGQTLVGAGTLAVQAGRDLNTDAAQIASTGDALLAAARDVNLNAIRQSSDDHVQWDEKKRAAHSATLDSGSAVGSGGSIGIVAGRDFNATAASVSAQGGVTALAGRDVNLNAGEQSVSAYDEHEVKESGLLSSRSTHTIDASSYTDAIGTTFSGNTVKVLAGENLTARAATIAGTGDVNLEAGKDLRVTTARHAERRAGEVRPVV